LLSFAVCNKIIRRACALPENVALRERQFSGEANAMRLETTKPKSHAWSQINSRRLALKGACVADDTCIGATAVGAKNPTVSSRPVPRRKKSAWFAILSIG